MRFKHLSYFTFIIVLFSCAQDDKSTTENQAEMMDQPTEEVTNKRNYLALGDSYTIGQSVCDTCRFPVQLKDSLLSKNSEVEIEVKIIATTGWTTTNLLNAIETEQP